MKIKKRPNNYYLEVYLAVKEGIGSRLHEIGRKVAIALDEEAEALLSSDKNEWGYKLTDAFRKKIENNLNNLWTDGKIFKQYFDNENMLLTEDEVTSMSGSQYKTYYYPSMAKSQITNEGLLLNAGIYIEPLNESLHFRCSEMTDHNPSPLNSSRILFINDYKRAICCDFEHLDLPITFCFTNKSVNKQKFADYCLKELENKEIKSTRVAIVYLDNSSYDYRNIPENLFVAVSFNSIDEIKYYNLTSGYIEIASDSSDYIYKDTNEYFKRLSEHVKSSSHLDKKDQIKSIDNFEFELKREGFATEVRELENGQVTENMSYFDPTFIKILNYEMVFYLGKKA